MNELEPISVCVSISARAEKRHQFCGATLPITAIYVDKSGRRVHKTVGVKACLVSAWSLWGWCEYSEGMRVQVRIYTIKDR
jgi:hypothetical protein